jgi:sialic acid synthase SpsE
MSVTIIAEAGITHGGSLDTAKKLVEIAIKANVDIVKFQTFDTSKLLRPNDPAHKVLDQLALSYQDTKKLSQFCDNMGIEFLSTPGDVDSLKFLVEECGVKRIKIGSDDLTYEPLLNAAYFTELPVILSTGMATFDEIFHAIPAARFDITLMHCVSLYPCPLDKCNLNAINTLRSYFPLNVGYSDHTESFIASQMAIACGATMIEKHFMPARYSGPDWEVSLSPGELPVFVDYLREAEAMMGNGIKEPCEEEKANIKLFRKDKDGYRGLSDVHS